MSFIGIAAEVVLAWNSGGVTERDVLNLWFFGQNKVYINESLFPNFWKNIEILNIHFSFFDFSFVIISVHISHIDLHK